MKHKVEILTGATVHYPSGGVAAVIAIIDGIHRVSIARDNHGDIQTIRRDLTEINAQLQELYSLRENKTHHRPQRSR